MKIVIEIHEKDYQSMKNGHIPFSVLDAIMKGTPLPEHHGRLIYEPTKEEIEKTIGGQSDFAECIRDSVKVVFDNAPTIIEADKER